MSAPDIILDLVSRFRDSYDFYTSANYNEAQLRQEFINPFFEALGWDMTNKAGYAPQYRDVIHEDSQKQSDGKTKAPDYAFRLGPSRIFFLEAKKPHTKIKIESDPAFQLRRYGWNAHMPLSILTNFDKFAVYDCRTRPNEKDSPATGRLILLSYEDYLEKWDEIASIFSKEAVLKGAFDRFAEDKKGKKGTTEVDSEFLKEIENWRIDLAHNIARRNFSRASSYQITNHNQAERDLNYAVQTTIDRILFLRICEDRKIEPENQLFEIANGKAIYANLLILFQKADQKYNSGLFHFSTEKDQTSEPDSFTPSLMIDDIVLRKIISNTYYPCPYIFNEIPVEILGQVYEQFLGSVIRLTPAGMAKVEEKPEVRKAGGVYYTPRYIVDYIVQNTIGKLLNPESQTPSIEGSKGPKALSPEQALKTRIVDPACGSGSFLLGAYQFLLDYHLSYYLNHEPKNYLKGKNPALVPTDDGGYSLSLEAKKRILTSCIFGVDIDSQAVEVTKLSLLLKLLEGEKGQLSLGIERILPDLGNNIRCGNSLIGWDYFKDQLFADEEEIYRVNPFNWEAAFPQVFADGGFDAVIGNPPYIRIQSIREWAPKDVDHYRKIYPSAKSGNFDIYVMFIEKGLDLLNPVGKLGFILPHKFFQAEFAKPIREIISKGKHLEEIIHFGAEQVFSNATTYTCLLFLNKQATNEFRFTSVKNLNAIETTLRDVSNGKMDENHESTRIPAPEYSDKEWYFSANNADLILDKLRQQPITLGDVTKKIFQGIATSADKIYVLEKIEERDHTVLCYSRSLEKEVEIEKGLLKPFLMGKDVHKYETPKPKNYVIFPYQIDNPPAKLMPQAHIKEHYPLGWNYLQENRKALSGREKGKMVGDQFYSYIYPKNLVDFAQPKIMTPDIAKGTQFTFDNCNLYHTTTVYSLSFNQNRRESPLYFLGILNSPVMWFFLSNTGNILRGGYFRFKTNYLNPFPIPTVDFNNPKSVENHDRLVNLVKTMLDLKQRTPTTPLEKDQLNRAIDATSKAIDQLVYGLYNLSNEEIELIIVESKV